MEAPESLSRAQLNRRLLEHLVPHPPNTLIDELRRLYREQVWVNIESQPDRSDVPILADEAELGGVVGPELVDSNSTESAFEVRDPPLDDTELDTEVRAIGIGHHRYDF